MNGAKVMIEKSKKKENDKKMNAKDGKRTFNAVDAIIIVCVIAVALSALVIFRSSGIFGTKETVDIEYVIFINRLRSEIVQHITEGSKVIEGSKKYIIGESVKVTKEPYTEEVFSYQDNKLVVSEVPGLYNAYITVKAKAVLEEDGYYVNGYRISTGTYVYARLPDFCGYGYVTNVSNVSR